MTGDADAPGLDFVIVGAAKAGTTALFHLLRTHPGLFLPEGKELPYFVAPKHTYYESEGTAHEWQTWRRSLFGFAPLLFKSE